MKIRLNRAALEIRMIQWMLQKKDESMDYDLEECLRVDSKLSFRYKQAQKGMLYLENLKQNIFLDQDESNKIIYSFQNKEKPSKKNYAEKFLIKYYKNPQIQYILISGIFLSLIAFYFLPEQLNHIKLSKNEEYHFIVHRSPSDVSIAPLLSALNISNIHDQWKKRNIANEEKPLSQQNFILQNALFSQTPKLAHENSASQPNLTVNSSNISNHKGFVIRAQLKVEHSEFDKSLFDHWLTQFNPEKAGQVELGWLKNDYTYYYHFITDLQHEETIKDFLNKKGFLSWSKDPHFRILPEGKTRIILEIHLR